MTKSVGPWVVWGLSLALASCSGGQSSGSSEGSGTSQSSGSQAGTPSGDAEAGAAATSSGDAGAAASGAGDGGGAAVAEIPPMPEGLRGPTKPWAQMTPEERGHYMSES